MHFLYSLLIFGTLALAASSLRCHCTQGTKEIECHNAQVNGFCEVHKHDGKIPACAFVRKGARQTFACVRVNAASHGDTCKVETMASGTPITRCWCTSGDYCNMDLEDKVSDGDEDNQDEDDEVMEVNSMPIYDNPKAESTDDGTDLPSIFDNVEEDDFEKDNDVQPPLPPAMPHEPPRSASVDSSPIPPWRRQMPSGEGRVEPITPPPRPSERTTSERPNVFESKERRVQHVKVQPRLDFVDIKPILGNIRTYIESPLVSERVNIRYEDDEERQWREQQQKMKEDEENEEERKLEEMQRREEEEERRQEEERRRQEELREKAEESRRKQEEEDDRRKIAEQLRKREKELEQRRQEILKAQEEIKRRQEEEKKLREDQTTAERVREYHRRKELERYEREREREQEVKKKVEQYKKDYKLVVYPPETTRHPTTTTTYRPPTTSTTSTTTTTTSSTSTTTTEPSTIRIVTTSPMPRPPPRIVPAEVARPPADAISEEDETPADIDSSEEYVDLGTVSKSFDSPEVPDSASSRNFYVLIALSLFSYVIVNNVW